MPSCWALLVPVRDDVRAATGAFVCDFRSCLLAFDGPMSGCVRGPMGSALGAMRAFALTDEISVVPDNNSFRHWTPAGEQRAASDMLLEHVPEARVEASVTVHLKLAKPIGLNAVSVPATARALVDRHGSVFLWLASFGEAPRTADRNVAALEALLWHATHDPPFASLQKEPPSGARVPLCHVACC